MTGTQDVSVRQRSGCIILQRPRERPTLCLNDLKVNIIVTSYGMTENFGPRNNYLVTGPLNIIINVYYIL